MLYNVFLVRVERPSFVNTTVKFDILLKVGNNTATINLSRGTLLRGLGHSKQKWLAVCQLPISAVCQPAAGCKERPQLPLQYLLWLRQLCPLLMLSLEVLYILIYVCCPARWPSYGVRLLLPVANLASLNDCSLAGRYVVRLAIAD